MRKWDLLIIVTALNAQANELCDNQNICTFDCAKTLNDSCTAVLNKDTKTLTITGYGDMKDYEWSCTPDCHNTADWGSYQHNIQKVVIENESSSKTFDSIGVNAFEYMFNLQEVILPDGLKKIGNEAFHNAILLEKINFPDSIEDIGVGAFSTTKLSNVTLPKNLEKLYGEVFGGTLIEKITIPENITDISPTAFIYGNHITPIKKIYCEESIKDKCEAAMEKQKEIDPNVSVITYKQNADGSIFYNNHWYNSANDILMPNSHIKKRIYTIDEASKVSGNTNRVSIKYR